MRRRKLRHKSCAKSLALPNEQKDVASNIWPQALVPTSYINTATPNQHRDSQLLLLFFRQLNRELHPKLQIETHHFPLRQLESTASLFVQASKPCQHGVLLFCKSSRLSEGLITHQLALHQLS